MISSILRSAGMQPGYPPNPTSTSPLPVQQVPAVTPVVATTESKTTDPHDQEEQSADSQYPSSSTKRPGQLTEKEKQEVERLKRRDAEVRSHEQAHRAAGGPHTGGPQYSYERGPDGRLYAVDGQVKVDTSPVSGDPQATIRKMQQVKRAALAPADPSGQDRRVATKAAAEEARARQQLQEMRAQAAKEAQGRVSEPPTAEESEEGGSSSMELSAPAPSSPTPAPRGSRVSTAYLQAKGGMTLRSGTSVDVISCQHCGGVHSGKGI